MNRRSLTIALHWTNWVLLLLLLGLGPLPVLAWGFALAGLGMVALALAFGLMSGPGPKLDGTLRAAHPWMHRAMYAALAFSAGLTLGDQLGLGAFGISPKSVYFALFGAGMLHGIFHLWRHTALGDGTFRRMTPKALHGIL